MAETTAPPKPSRAAYLRAYRARTATPREPHICPQCHQSFAVERSDARYCSEACRASAWRSITHRHVIHRLTGWKIPANQAGAGKRRQCAFQFSDHRFCRRPATWLMVSCRNEDRHLHALAYRCEEHARCKEYGGHGAVLAEKPTCDAEAACHTGAPCPVRRATPVKATLERKKRIA